MIPSAFDTLRIRRGFTRMPSLGNTEYDATCSSSVISTAPSAIGRYAGIFDVTPKRWAISMTLRMPTRAASLTAGMLRDSAKALIRRHRAL